ncbi:hypothetical protein KC336_g18298, partial [Hortaea werneckii]
SLGCCRALYCIRCIIRMQDDKTQRCPACNAEGTVMRADARNLDFEAIDFLEKYFPLETKKRQKENETASLARQYGEEFVKPGCRIILGKEGPSDYSQMQAGIMKRCHDSFQSTTLHLTYHHVNNNNNNNNNINNNNIIIIIIIILFFVITGAKER